MEKTTRTSRPPTRREGLPFGKREPYEAIEKLGQDGLSGVPTEVTVFPTYMCNLRCYMCHVHHTRDKVKPEIPVDQLVTSLHNKQLSTVFYLGGEPFVRKDFFEILEKFDAKGIRQIVSTNGTLIDESIAKRLVALGNLICMQVSLNGTREVDAVIRRSSSAFDKTDQAIKLMKGLGLRVWIHCTIVNENVHNLGDLVNLGGELGLDRVNFLFAQIMSEHEAMGTEEILERWLGEKIRVGGYVGKINYTLEELQAGVAAAKEAGSKAGVRVSFFPRAFGERPDIYWHGTVRQQEKPFCQMVLMPPMTPCVGPVGEVYGCPVIDKTFGNVLDAPLQEIWNSEPLRAFRKGLVNDKLMPVCTRCPSGDALL